MVEVLKYGDMLSETTISLITIIINVDTGGIHEENHTGSGRCMSDTDRMYKYPT